MPIDSSSSILITGGTGSFGKAFISSAAAPDIRRIVIYSRDELKQWELSRFFQKLNIPNFAFSR